MTSIPRPPTWKRWPGLPGSELRRAGPGRLVLGLVILVAGGLVTVPRVASADLPEEPTAQGSLLLPGRLPWGPSALPSGEILAPCEDQSLSVLDAASRVVTQWAAPSRIAGPVTVAPRGPTQLVAVPEVTGRIDVLVWDALTRRLAQAWAATRNAEPGATAWGPSGTLYVAWKDGHAEAWSPRGSRLWEADAGFSVTQLLVDESVGAFAFGPGHVVLFDGRGRDVDHWPLAGRPRGVLQTTAGQILCWTDAGLWSQGPAPGPFTAFDGAGDILGVTVDRQDRIVVTTPDRVRRFSPDRSQVTSVPLPRPAVVAAVLDDRGRTLVGTARGLEEWTYDGRFLGLLGDAAPAAPPVLTDQGLAAWGQQDWKVQVWSGFRLPPFGWAQDGGSPGRGFSARRPASVAVRSVNWADDPQFGYFFELASSGDEAKQATVLDQFSAAQARGTLLSQWPWANVVLLKIARSGLVDLQMGHGRVANNWPGNRQRANGLLAQTAGTEDRAELLTILAKEFDPAVVGQGFQALARSGWDGDGKILRLLAEVQARMPAQAVVADAAVDAARALWAANGRSTDPVLVPLVTAVYQGPFPRSVKAKAQRFFQDLMDAP